VGQSGLYLGFYERYLRDLSIYRVFVVGPSNVVNQILPPPSLVAMATKFETKWAIIQLVYGLCSGSLVAVVAVIGFVLSAFNVHGVYIRLVTIQIPNYFLLC